MRKFYLHTFDRSKTFNLNTETAIAVNPTGLGNSFDIAYKESEKGKHVANVKPAFDPIVLQIYFNADFSSGYANYKSIMQFIATCGTDAFLFEYDDGATDKFCDVRFKSATKTEKDENGLFLETFTFDRQTYWYEQIAETFDLKNNSSDPSFPLPFPFGFVGLSFVNAVRVKNPFFEPAPVSIKISGYIERNIDIYLKNVATDEIVSEIALSRGNVDGSTIEIEPNGKKITVTDIHGDKTDGYNLTDKTKQSFLYLPQGEFMIGANITNNDSGKIEISIKRYLLD